MIQNRTYDDERSQDWCLVQKWSLRYRYNWIPVPDSENIKDLLNILAGQNLSTGARGGSWGHRKYLKNEFLTTFSNAGFWGERSLFLLLAYWGGETTFWVWEEPCSTKTSRTPESAKSALYPGQINTYWKQLQLLRSNRPILKKFNYLH